MLTIELHEEVVKFLRQVGSVFHYSDGEEGFQVNNAIYRSTNKEGLYTVSYIDLSYAEE